ncbi:MAG: hypothetical protein IPN67_00365 [Bacteroidales bacterium]|nr:hypothetical protein [Bacteroidales bacterium]
MALQIIHGYNGKILFIDLNKQTFRFEERDADFWRKYVGGGLTSAFLLCEQTEPGIDPLSKDNLLIFSSSVVAGQPAPGLARFTTAAKSPLTGGIGETRTEGPFGAAIKGSGADIIVLKGRAQSPVSVLIDKGTVSIIESAGWWGMQVGQTADSIENKFGSNVHHAVIGPAGENLVRFASIVTDRTFQASRMGMGAVMGSKNLKALIIKENSIPSVFNEKVLNSIAEDFSRRLISNNLSKWQLEAPGFSCWLYLHGLDAALCTNNYSKSSFENIDSFKEENFLSHRINDLLCPGCPNNCIKRIHPNGSDDLDPRASGIHQEITGTMGPNIGINDLDMIFRYNNLCNQYGLDPTSLGFTISFAMELFEKGILTGEDGDALKFGDGNGILKMIQNIALRMGLGSILAEGTKRASEIIGKGSIRYAMQVKGLEMVPFEPRSQTNLAMGYSVAPTGPRYDICEHDWDFDTKVGWAHSLTLCRTLGILERIPMNYIGPEKVKMFKQLLTIWSAADALDMCIFAIAPTRLLSLPQMAQMLHAVTGWETSDHEIMRIGERRLHLMRWYNQREGITSADDILPERFYSEPIGDGPRIGDVIDKENFKNAIKMFYEMIGWDENAIPRPATLYDHGLEWLIDDSVDIKN